jgi:hypothetical protein
MVMGLIGGVLEEFRKTISIKEAFAFVSGDSYTVEFEQKDYIKAMELEEKYLHPNKMWYMGWYCSIPADGSFFNEANFKVQLGWQMPNIQAIAISIFPKELFSDNINDLIKIFRIKDGTSNDYSRNNWHELDFTVVGNNVDVLVEDLRSKYEKIEKIINGEEFRAERLKKALHKIIDFEIDDKNGIIEKLVKDLENIKKNEFKINEFLSVRLEQEKTNIYVKGLFFNQCKYLLLNIPVNEITCFEEIESIDEAAEKLDRSLERTSPIKYEIPPETEFWGHCSNLQVWVENDYNTRLLHSNLAFPLLKKLAEVGDPKAKRVFKEEIARRYESGVPSVVMYLEEEGYLEYLSKEELDAIK